jgi:hypothetical protein
VNHEPFKDVVAGIQSITAAIHSLTASLVMVVGGLWALWRFGLPREAAPKLDLDANLSFVHQQGTNWVAEGVALMKNPGRVRLNFKAFTYELRYALSCDIFEWKASQGGVAQENTFQYESLRPSVKGSWLKRWDCMYLEPGECSRYSFIACLPPETTVVGLRCEVTDKKGKVETVDKLFAIPPSNA